MHEIWNTATAFLLTGSNLLFCLPLECGSSSADIASSKMYANGWHHHSILTNVLWRWGGTQLQRNSCWHNTDGLKFLYTSYRDLVPSSSKVQEVIPKCYFVMNCCGQSASSSVVSAWLTRLITSRLNHFDLISSNYGHSSSDLYARSTFSF